MGRRACDEKLGRVKVWEEALFLDDGGRGIIIRTNPLESTARTAAGWSSRGCA